MTKLDAREWKACLACGEMNPPASLYCKSCRKVMVGQARPGTPESGSSARRPRWLVALVVAGGLAVIGLAVLVLASRANTRRHLAATYGIVDPSLAALRIESGTATFNVIRVTLLEARTGVEKWSETLELRDGEGATYQLQPGDYSLVVAWVEANQAAAYRPQGDLYLAFSASAGQAVLCRFQGGRSSPDGMVFVSPELVLK